MAECRLKELPEELLVHILECLDSSPPSETKLRQEPSLELTVSDHHTYKAVSCVSKLFRRLALPLLFRHARLRLDATPPKNWSQCTLCCQSAFETGLEAREPSGKGIGCVDRYHADMLDDAVQLLATARHDERNPPGSSSEPQCREQTMTTNFLTWVPRFYHGLRDVLDFLLAQNLTSTVESFVLMTDKMLDEKFDRFPHRAAADMDWRYKAAAALWQHLLSIINPLRIAILAPPMDLACLANCAIDTFGDWAFGDMDFHILDLRVTDQARAQTELVRPVLYSSLDYMPHRFPGMAGSSVLNLRPWSSISVNEGAFLKAYGTYEYFERGPPSLIYSIKDSLSPRPIFNANAQRISHVPLASLRKFTYTAIFPFANHLDFRELLPQLEELDIQIAPEVDSDILTRPDRVGKAELQDCWSELMSIYDSIAAQLATFRISDTNVPRLKYFICCDSKIPALRNELDEVFISLCLPVWAEYEPGVFTRLAKRADILGWEERPDG